MARSDDIADNPRLGILLMLGFCVLAPLADAFAKLLSERIDIGPLLLFRFAVQVAIFLPAALLYGQMGRPAPRVLRLVFWRTVLHITGIGVMFLALRFLPLAETVAIAYVMPFIILALGALFLGEAVGPHRIWASVIGFAGTLMVVQPTFAVLGWPALLPVIVAVDFAIFTLVTRAVAKDIGPIAMQALSGAMALAILVPVLALAALFDAPETRFAAPVGREWLYLAAMAVFSPGAHLVLTIALRIAPSSTLAPMQYLEIPVAAFLGWLIFRDFPNALAITGITVTVGAGLYVVRRERRLMPSVPPAPRGAPTGGG